MLLALAAVLFSLAGFDAYLTRRRVLDYGAFVEINPLIVQLIIKLGPDFGPIIGIMLPAAAWIGLFVKLGWPVALAMMIGYRLKLFVSQIQSLQFEGELKELRAELERRHQQRLLGNPPPNESSDSESLLTPPEDKNDRQS